MRDGPRLAVVQGHLWGAERPSPALEWVANRTTEASRNTARWAVRTLVKLLGGDPDRPEGLNWARLSRDDVKRLRRALIDRYRPTTAETYMASLRAILREAVRMRQIDHADFMHITDVPAIGGEVETRGRALSEAEIAAVLKAARTEPTSWRGLKREHRKWRVALDLAVLSLILRTGLRRFEVCKLELRDYSPASKTLLLRAGKGRKDARLRVGPKVQQHIAAWLRVRGVKPGPLFCEPDGSAMNKKTLNVRLKAIAKRAGVDHFSPHDCRYTFGTAMVKRGDLFLAQRALRHRHISSTRRYDKRPDEEAWDMVEAFDAELPS